ncbi:ATP-grasp domain-containing protein [Streptomyces sp. NPDC002536]
MKHSTDGSSPTVAIVDPFSTGAALAEEFAARGWRSVAVISRPDLPEGLLSTARWEHFDRRIPFAEDLDATVAELRAENVAAVVAGTEIGVETADELAERLGLEGNGTELSRCRRDKFAMAERLRSQGLDAADGILTGDVEELAEWFRARGGSPVVVKPVASAGSDSVTFCTTETEVREAFGRIHGRPDQIGGHNAEVLGQELLTGDQYFINTVSHDGRHHVCEIWHDVRRPISGHSLAYDLERLMPARGPVQDVLTAYVLKVLDALGIRYGAGHSEVMLTERGPVLIETGARMQGTILPSGPKAGTGHNVVTRSVDCYAATELFEELPDRPYELAREVRVVSLIVPFDGTIDGELAQEIFALPTLHGIQGRIEGGQAVQRTVDLFTSPASVYLISDDIDQLEQDYLRLRKLEESGLYRPAPTPAAAP